MACRLVALEVSRISIDLMFEHRGVHAHNVGVSGEPEGGLRDVDRFHIRQFGKIGEHTCTFGVGHEGKKEQDDRDGCGPDDSFHCFRD